MKKLKLAYNQQEENRQDVCICLPFFTSNISAGFPSPADDCIEKNLDLNEYLIKNKSATFFVRVSGDSMINIGIFPNDILIVDRSLTARHSDIIIAAVYGELTVKKLFYKNNQVILLPENKKYRPIIIESEDALDVWGVVINGIRHFR